MASSFFLGLEASSTYSKGTPPALSTPEASLDGHFEHPPVRTEEREPSSDPVLK